MQLYPFREGNNLVTPGVYNLLVAFKGFGSPSMLAVGFDVLSQFDCIGFNVNYSWISGFGSLDASFGGQSNPWIAWLQLLIYLWRAMKGCIIPGFILHRRFVLALVLLCVERLKMFAANLVVNLLL